MSFGCEVYDSVDIMLCNGSFDGIKVTNIAFDKGEFGVVLG